MASILIIDDDEQARAFIREALKRAGHDVAEASDGDDGTRRARELRPALVITDILMPNKEGLEVIRELREHDRTLPIIAMSGGSQRMAPHDVLQVASYLGACKVLLKPFAMNELLSAVDTVLAQPRA